MATLEDEYIAALKDLKECDVEMSRIRNEVATKKRDLEVANKKSVDLANKVNHLREMLGDSYFIALRIASLENIVRHREYIIERVDDLIGQLTSINSSAVAERRMLEDLKTNLRHNKHDLAEYHRKLDIS